MNIECVISNYSFTELSTQDIDLETQSWESITSI